MLNKIKNDLPFELSIQIKNDRPDFRTVAAFLFASDSHNFDSDGNSYPVTSRQWTELYISSRVMNDYKFSVYPAHEEPLILTIHASRKYISYAIAYFLAIETQGEIFNNTTGVILSPEYIQNKLKNFPLQKHLTFAQNSVWRKSTEDNPYPNLNP